MNKEIKILSPSSSKIADFCEQGAMVLLLALGLAQIAIAFGACSHLIKSGASIVAIAQS